VTTGVTLDGAAGALAPRRRWMMAAVSVAMSAGLLALCLLLVDARQVRERLAAAEPRWLLAFFGVYVLQVLLLGLRWSLISRQLGVPLGWRRACSEYALSIVINVLLPTGFAGDGWRALRHAGRSPGHRLPKILETLALDRLSGQLALVLAVLATAPFAVQAGLVSPREGAVALGVLTVVLWGASRWVRQTSLTDGRSAALRRFVRRAASVLLHPRRGAGHLALSLLLVATHLVQLWLAARAAGIVLDVFLLCWLGPLISLSASVPSFFGSWGIREGACALLFASAGLPGSAGVAVSLLVGTFSLFSALPGALVLLTDGHATRRDFGRAGRGLAELRSSLGGGSVRRLEPASTDEPS
jgi:glycosyltransferase 2 family protein